MSRQRVHKGAAKRFKVTKNGKVLHRSHYLRHLRSNKSKAQVRRLKTIKETTGVAAKKIRRILGLA
ncbi:50S ribosomal protein L35 [Candidatus Microgenomates bacterium]|nr:50S ribosomal protein L35 [Candidatus Microgenomates bacterium]